MDYILSHIMKPNPFQENTMNSSKDCFIKTLACGRKK